MKTVLITDGTTVPEELRDIIRKGSTSLDEFSAGGRVAASQTASDLPLRVAERVVFWTSTQDDGVLSHAACTAAAAPRPGAIFFVPADRGQAIAGLSDRDLFVWPRDEDRRRMAFMTSA